MLKPIFLSLLGLGLLVSTQGISQRPLKSFLEEINYPNSRSSNSGQRISDAKLDFGDTPTLRYSGSFGGSSKDLATSIISDASGNVYVSGYFSGNITVDDTPVASIGISDGFLAKYNSSGELQWWNVFDAQEEGYIKPMTLILDASEDLILAGTFEGTLDFGIDDPISSDSKESIFYARVNAAGSFTSNNVYHTGLMSSDLVIKMEENDEDLYILLDYAQIDSYFLAFDNTDELIIDQSHDEGFTDFVINGSDIYLSGVLSSSDDGTFNNGVNVVVNFETRTNGFVAKMNLSGSFQWVVLIDHEEEEDIYSGTSAAYDVTIGLSDELILSGKITSYGGFDAFTMDESGTFFAVFDSNGAFQSLTVSAEDADFEPFQLVTNGSSGYIEYNEERFYARDSDLLYDYELELDCTLKSVFVNGSNKILRCGTKSELIFFRQEAQTTHTADFEFIIDGNSAESAILAVESDATGNVYYYGYATNSLEAFGETIESGYFLVKVATDESVKWIKNLKTDSDRMNVHLGIGEPMKIDPTGGYIYLLAAFEGQLKLSDDTSLDAHEDGSTAIVKFDTGGNFSTWWKEDLVDYDFDLAVDQEANVILSGIFHNTTELGGESLSPKGSSDGFVVKYNSSGVAQWSKQLGGTDVEYSTFTDVDDEGNIYVSGEFKSDDIFLNGVSILKAPKGDGNVFLAKLNAEGELQWTRVTGRNVEADSHNEDITWPTGIVVDGEGNSYLKGWMAKSIYFDDVLLEFEGSNYHHFITKLDNKGNVLWADGIEQTERFGFDYNEFEIDALGNVYFAIQATEQINFADALSYTPEEDYTDLYITKYTSDGDFGWLKVIKGGTEVSQIYGLAVVGTHKICAGGYFIDEINLGSTTTTAGHVKSGFYAAFDVSNQVPVFVSEPETDIEAGVKYSYSIVTEDKDEMPTLSITTIDLPDWLELTDHGDGTATLEGTPAEENMEDQEISLYVSDAVQTNATKQAFTLTKMEESQVTGIAKNIIGAQIFPNPTDDALKLTSIEPIEASSIAIVNSSGKVIKLHSQEIQVSGKAAHIDISSLNSGLYIIRFKSGSDVVNRTFLKK